MRDDQLPTADLLPRAAPDCPYGRLLLYALRRMATGGLDDAFAAHAMLAGFGAGFRRPLILLRAFMAEAAHVSAVKLAVAPCCCPRVTRAEAALLGAVAMALADPSAAQRTLCATLHVHSCLGLVTSAQAVAAAFADQGMPLAPLQA